MIFTTTSLFAAGVAAAAIPIAIHLLSKGKPRKVVFAAVRFTQATLATNRRKLRMKRLLLLSLRVLLLVLLGAALARPLFTTNTPATIVDRSVDESAAETDTEVESAPETAGLVGKEAPVSAAIVVDTSARMGRVKDNTTLLARATATARTILDQLPKGSEVAILDGSAASDGFQSDRFAAKTRLEKLRLTPGGRSAAQTTLEALALVKGSKLARREIYVLTDRTTAGWSDRDLRRIKKAVPDAAETAPTFYFVDFGDDDCRNTAILDASPSAETISESSALRVDAELERLSPTDGDVTVEALFFSAQDLPNALTPEELVQQESKAFRREKQTISFEAGKSRATVVFNVSGLPVGECVGAIRLVGKDALAGDDVRPFVVDVVPDWRLLVVAPRPVADKAIFLTQALAPDEFQKTGRAPFTLDVVPYEAASSDQQVGAVRDLTGATAAALEKYRAIFLLDPPPLAPEIVAKLAGYAEVGGGIGIFLGRAAKPIDAFQTPDAVALLGVKPTTAESAPTRDYAIAPVSYDAPLLAEFRPFQRGGIPWDAAPVSQYWRLEEPSETASIVARFASASAEEPDSTNPPAIVENRVGRGLVATVATPISDGAQEKAWNALTSGDAVWVFVVLADSMARRLASASSSILNYTTGESATLRSELREFPAVATVYTPDGSEISAPADVERRQIRFPGVKEPGISRVRTTPNHDGESIDQVFAVTVPAEESDMTRRSDEEWGKHWEGLSYRALDVNATAEELESARDGKETEPYVFLVLLLAVIFLFETFVGNRFYKDAGDSAPKSKKPAQN